jgi:hypothetical protein
MIELLNFLIQHCSFLFEKPGFRFKDSRVGRNNAEGSWVLLESGELQIYISSELEAITCEVRSLHDTRSRDWFSFDLIAGLLGHQVESGLMNSTNRQLLSRLLPDIVNRFKKENSDATLQTLRSLRAQRTSKL